MMWLLIAFSYISIIAAPSISLAAEKCSTLLLAKTCQTIYNYQTLNLRVKEEFAGFKFDGMTALELLLASEMLSEDSNGRWVLLRDVREQIGADELDTTVKRVIAELFDRELWESKANPNKRTQKLVKLTDGGRALLNRIMGCEH
jgi:DNA-binding MarR family transcriptional regulator